MSAFYEEDVLDSVFLEDDEFAGDEEETEPDDEDLSPFEDEAED